MTEDSNEEHHARNEDDAAEAPTEALGAGEEPVSEGAPDEAPAPGYRRLYRSTDRMIGGVAGGIARYFRIDPTIVRIAFGLSVFFGGLGIAAYIAGLLFVPAEGDEERPAIRRMGWLGVIGAIIVGFIALILLGITFAGSAFAVGAGEGWICAGVLALLAVGLLMTRSLWLIAPVVAVIVAAGTAMALSLDLEGGIGERDYVPASIQEVPKRGYELGLGQLTVDLREIPWKRGDELDLNARLGVGHLRVVVPEKVCVVVGSNVDAGELMAAGAQADGWDVSILPEKKAETRSPKLFFYSSMNAGLTEVVNADGAVIDEGGSSADERAEMRLANQKACAR